MVTARCTSTLLHSAWSSGGIYPIYRLLDPLHKLRCWDESDFLEKLIASGCGTWRENAQDMNIECPNLGTQKLCSTIHFNLWSVVTTLGLVVKV